MLWDKTMDRSLALPEGLGTSFNPSLIQLELNDHSFAFKWNGCYTIFYFVMSIATALKISNNYMNFKHLNTNCMTLIKAYIWLTYFYGQLFLHQMHNIQQSLTLIPKVLEKNKIYLFDYLLGFKRWYHDLGHEQFQTLKDISIRTIEGAKIHLLWEETKGNKMDVNFYIILFQ